VHAREGYAGVHEWEARQPVVWPMGMLMMFVVRVCVQMSYWLTAVDVLVTI
jgi:hypothetical protein